MEKKQSIRILVIGVEQQMNTKIVDAMNKKELRLIAERPVEFDINAFNNYKDASVYLADVENKTIPTFVFLDYFGGNGVSGPHIVEILKKQYPQAEVILISNNEDEIGKVREQYDNNKVFDYVIKDDYTPTLCRLLLEKYVEKYS
ncbi:MAG: hypothetical protein KDC09_11185 [Bacteroidales bacterium]|nr:hypothetical protein [Bacteroidales bacterium]